LFATLSPIVLSSRTALWLSRTHAGNVALHLISTLAGLGAFKLRKSIHRLFLVAFGAAVAVLRQTTEWSGVNVLRHATSMLDHGSCVFSVGILTGRFTQ